MDPLIGHLDLGEILGDVFVGPWSYGFQPTCFRHLGSVAEEVWKFRATRATSSVARPAGMWFFAQ